jgi:hypothetical protein
VKGFVAFYVLYATLKKVQQFGLFWLLVQQCLVFVVKMKLTGFGGEVSQQVGHDQSHVVGG